MIEFLDCLQKEGINQSEFAERCAVGSAAISRFLGGTRPEDHFFRGLISAWKTPGLSERMVLSHLRDEIERAGQPLAAFKLEVVAREEQDRWWEARLEALRVYGPRLPEAGKIIDNLILLMIKTVVRGERIKRKNGVGQEASDSPEVEPPL